MVASFTDRPPLTPLGQETVVQPRSQRAQEPRGPEPRPQFWGLKQHFPEKNDGLMNVVNSEADTNISEKSEKWKRWSNVCRQF